MVKNLPAMRETWVGSLGWEDPLEKEIAAHSNIFAWRIPWTEEAGSLQSMGSQRIGYSWKKIVSLLCKVKHQNQQKLSSSVLDCLFSTCVFATQVAGSKMQLQGEPTIPGDT